MKLKYESMKMIGLMILLLLPTTVFSEIYKCERPDGTLKFSDKECSKKESKEIIKTSKPDWITQIRNKKQISLRIFEIVKKGENVTIIFDYESISDANSFIKMVAELSNKSVSFLRTVSPRDSALSRGTINVSNKQKSFFDKFQNKKELDVDKNYNIKKCVKVSSYYSNRLTQSEICRYRGKGCLPNLHNNAKVNMHCLEEKISDCFENEKWITITELVELDPNIKVKSTSSTLSVIKGVKSMTICALYDE